MRRVEPNTAELSCASPCAMARWTGKQLVSTTALILLVRAPSRAIHILLIVVGDAGPVLMHPHDGGIVNANGLDSDNQEAGLSSCSGRQKQIIRSQRQNPHQEKGTNKQSTRRSGPLSERGRTSGNPRQYGENNATGCRSTYQARFDNQRGSRSSVSFGGTHSPMSAWRTARSASPGPGSACV